MESQRWDELRALLERLLELERPARARLLADTWRDDPGLARELRRLLRHERRGDGFMEPPGTESVRAGGGPAP